MADLAVLIPAAGRAARMRGRDKLLEVVDGMPLLRRQAWIAQRLGVPVLVTLRADDPDRHMALRGMEAVDSRVVAGAEEGMSASLRVGAAWAAEIGAAGLMIMLADLPELQKCDLEALRAAFRDDNQSVIRATDAEGRPGHPVILPARLFGRVQDLRGDSGALAIVKGEPVRRVVLPGNRATTDLDTPEDWAAWRAGRLDRGA